MSAHLRLLPLLLAWVAATPAVAAQDAASLLHLPVVNSAEVPPSQYTSRLQPAAGTGSALTLALQVAGPFEGRQQLVLQTFDRPESATAAQVLIVRDGLLDDALRTERWDIHLARTPAGGWQVVAVKKAWRCRRGAIPAQLDALPCP